MPSFANEPSHDATARQGTNSEGFREQARWTGMKGRNVKLESRNYKQSLVSRQRLPRALVYVGWLILFSLGGFKRKRLRAVLLAVARRDEAMTNSDYAPASASIMNPFIVCCGAA
jgi:hypothetical protein